MFLNEVLRFWKFTLKRLIFPFLYSVHNDRYGCTNNNCSTYEPRNVVWITPIADADIYVDFKNQGSNLTVYPRKALSSTKITDPYDKDMSGAIIFATEPNSTASGRSVPSK